MATETIDQLKRDLTDQYVIVTGGRPELARFEGVVGQVKTVNMSGRALVEFTGYHNNPAWHDIDPACLKVVDKPPTPAPAAEKAAKPASKVPTKPGGKSAADVLAAVRGGASKPAAKPDAAGRAPKKTSPSVGKSTADILAAARGGSKKPKIAEDAPAGENKKVSPAVAMSTADVLAAARGKKPSSDASDGPAKPDKKPAANKQKSGMTTEEILAAARASKKPAAEEPKPSAIDELTAEGAQGPEPRRHLSAADIRDIGLGKLSIKREMRVATAPKEANPRPEASADAKPEALPEKVDHTKLTAADILAMGRR